MIILLLLLMQGSMYIVDITDTGYAVISSEITITALKPMDTYTYYLPFPINHLEVYSDVPVTGEYTIMGRQTEVTLHVSLEEGQSAFCICEYLTWEIISKEGTQWWVYLPSIEEPVTVIMPEGANISYLVTESDFPLISEEKGRINLYWEHLPEEVYIYYELSAEPASFSMWFFVPAIAVLGAGIGYYVIKRVKSPRLSKTVLSVLNEREQAVVEYLHKKGRSRQAKISRGCHIPKTSLSKMLIKMEERGIIKRERDGNITLCELDEKVYR